MKQNLLLLILIIPALSFAQNLKQVKKRLSSTLTEKYTVLEDNRKVKHGLYEVLDDKSNVVVKGAYTNGNKDGVWEYYNDNGYLVQKYDFTKSDLVHYVEDSSSYLKTSYELLKAPSKNDEIDIPYKIGGDFYQLNLLYDQRNIPQDIVKDKLDVVMTYILTISEKGKLEDWTVLYKGEYYNKTVRESIKNLPDDAYEFHPALVNNQPVKSKLIYSVSLNNDVLTVPRTNNVVTRKN